MRLTLLPQAWVDVTASIARERVDQITPGVATYSVRDLYGTSILPAPTQRFAPDAIPRPGMFLLATDGGDFLIQKSDGNSVAAAARVTDDY